jgi:hypothetical protein
MRVLFLGILPVDSEIGPEVLFVHNIETVRSEILEDLSR